MNDYPTPSDEGSGTMTVDPWARRLTGLHGSALVLVLLGGFGMLARIGVPEGVLLPGWIWAKLAIWTVVGGLIVVARRKGAWSAPALFLLPFLVAGAGVLAFTKPF